MAEDSTNVKSGRAFSPDGKGDEAWAPDLQAVEDGASGASRVKMNAPPAIAANDKTVISKRSNPAESSPPLIAAGPAQVGQMLIGKQLEHYQLDEFVGGGGMGAVFRATDTRLGRAVAVKVLLRDRADEETIRRFRNEAQSAARLDHPNIARVYYVGEDHGWNFIVFEFIEGTNLRDAVAKDGPLDPADALHCTLQVADALAHASSRDVIHRDIKPSNVLVTADNHVKLVDMGLARLHQVESSDDLTASGVTLGTFDYISPEQASDPRLADVRSDIYSLGCTLHFMLTGQPPFPDGTALQKLLRHSADDPPDVRIFRPDLPPQVAWLVAKMLAKRPAQRQQSAADLIADIVSVAEHLGLRSLAERGSLTLPTAAARRNAWGQVWQIGVPVATLIVAVILLESFLTSRAANHGVRPAPRFSKTLVAPAETGDGGAAETTATDGHAGLTDARPAAVRTSPISNGTVGSATPGAAAGALPSGAAITIDGTPESDLRGGAGVSEKGYGLAAQPWAASVAAEPSSAELSVSVSSGLGTTRPAPPKLKRVVLSMEEIKTPDPDCEYTSTLHDACRRAIAEGVTEVELRWNGRFIQKPLDISGARLSLRAAPGFKPILVFQPSPSERQMIRLSGAGSSRLSIQGVELRLELPPEPAQGWSLIAMSAGQGLDLMDCVLTVQDGDRDRAPMHEQVAVVSVQPRRGSDMMTMTDPQPAMTQSATINLAQCVVRGEATFIVMTDETPLTLHWTQGLLVLSRRLIETGGSATDPKWFEKIVIGLDAVTASCRQGLYQMRRSDAKDYQFTVDVTAEHCLLTTEAGAPLYEFVGAAPIAESDVHLQSAGDFNCYPNADVVFLRLRSESDGREQDFELDDRRWSTEARPQIGNPWLHPPSRDNPAHAATKMDFLVDPALATGVGFDPLRVPDAAARP
jgi:protein kinase-like protein